MKKKSILTLVLSLVLVGVISVGATMAYMTSTDTKTNVFTVGNVKITLTEPTYTEAEVTKAAQMYPGQTVQKNPIVTNTGKNDCYVRISAAKIAEMKSKGYVFYNGGTEGLNTTNWDLKADGFYYYRGIVKAGTTSNATEPLFTSVELPGTVKIAPDAQGVVPDYSFNLIITAQAVQIDGFVKSAGTFADADMQDAFNAAASQL